MLDATLKKLREARFFLSHLTAVEGRIFRQEPEAPSFYLSAFLSAARSVSDVIEAEEGETYRNWFSRRKASLTAGEAELLEFTNRQRIQTVHVLGPEVQTTVRLVPIYELQWELEEGGGTLEVRPGGVPGEPLPMPEAERSTLRFQSHPSETVPAICERYLELLARLVNEYETSIRATA